MNLRIRKILFLLSLVALLSGCGYDNYQAPSSRLYGKIEYKGRPIHIKSGSVTFNLFQTGFKEKIPIRVNVKQNGSYSALVFNGNYQIIFPKGQGPFIQNTKFDTLDVKVKGDTEQNIKVKPYYMFQKAKFSINRSGTVSVVFSLNQIFSRGSLTKIQYAALYINTTRFVDPQNHVMVQKLNQVIIGSNNRISADVPSLTPKQNYVFARVGIKIKSVEDMLFSRVVKLYLH